MKHYSNVSPRPTAEDNRQVSINEYISTGVIVFRKSHEEPKRWNIRISPDRRHSKFRYRVPESL